MASFQIFPGAWKAEDGYLKILFHWALAPLNIKRKGLWAGVASILAAGAFKKELNRFDGELCELTLHDTPESYDFNRLVQAESDRLENGLVTSCV